MTRDEIMAWSNEAGQQLTAERLSKIPLTAKQSERRQAMVEMVPRPRLIRRACGGILAVSPKHARFRIGITADSEAEAEHQFWISYIRFCELVPQDCSE